MKLISLKIEDRQYDLLKAVSHERHISQSSLIRQGIDLILRQVREGAISVELRREIRVLLKEDKELLNRLL